MKFRRSLLFLLFLFISASPLRAEFILDDFDDPAEVVSPEMFDEFISTDNVGTLNASRSIRISGAQGNPLGSLDSAISSPSILTGQISDLNPVPFGSTRAGIQANYEFPSSDFSEGGQNNALFFDFLQLTSEMPPSLFTVRLDDDVDFFFHFDTSFQLNSNPFTIVVPFDQLRTRGGPNVLDPTAIEFMSFSLRASTISGGGPDPLNFFVELDRIRVGRIPEPSTIGLLGCASVVLLRRRVGATT